MEEIITRGSIKAVGTQVGQNSAEMYIEIDNERIYTNDIKGIIHVKDK